MKLHGNFLLSAVAASCICLLAQPAWAQQASSPLRDAAQAAVLNNPEVLARWHTIKAAEAERDAAKGGFLPRVDLTAAAGPQRRSDFSGTDRASSATLSLTQLIWDGLATRNEVNRLDHAARVRLFEFFDTSETVALEASRAYLDVRRFRDLVRLAEDNFVEHRTVFGQTERRVQARIARAVDLEQVTGRLALAEANLLTETANLHDTSARFQRLIGRVPPGDMPMPAVLARDIPVSPVAALETAQRNHPGLRAAIENVRAAQAALATRNAAYQPRLDFRLRRDHGTTLGSAIAGANSGVNATAAEFVLSWNLFNGFADVNKEKQYGQQLNVTKDVRDKTCRDIRQTVVIAHNDIRKLSNQLEHLELHEAAVGRALVAYRQQFDLGQRSLLDLLDTENELFQAKRAVVNARHDLLLAHVRTQAGMGNLLRALELTSIDTGDGQATLASWSANSDAAQECPAEPIPVPAVDRQSLMQRVAERTMRPQPPSMAQAAPGAAQPLAPPAPAAGPATERDLRAALEAWRKAWADRNVAGYLGSYSPQFAPDGGVARSAWQQRRKAIIGKAADVSIELADVTVTVEGDRATTRFTQRYRSASYRDSVAKTIEWARVGGQWKIVRETSVPA